MVSQVSDTRCDQLVEEKGYVVGVINNVMMGVVQVSGWRRHEKREGENARLWECGDPAIGFHSRPKDG